MDARIWDDDSVKTCWQVGKSDYNFSYTFKSQIIGKRSRVTIASEIERNSQLVMHRRQCYKAKLLTGICSAFGDGEIWAWTPRPALIILLAFPTVWACCVVLTFTCQFAVVIYTHSGMEITLAPRQRRDREVIVSHIGLLVTTEALVIYLLGWWFSSQLYSALVLHRGICENAYR